MVFLHALSFMLGLALVAGTLLSAVKTFVLPRGIPDLITYIAIYAIRGLFTFRLRWATTYDMIDRVLAFFAPISLLVLLPVWLALVMIGYMGMFWALGIPSWVEALRASGSSLLTLGFVTLNDFPKAVLAFSEATIGLILIALLIAYLPTIYAAFSRRESAVTLLEVRAGSPPSAIEMIKRFYRIHGLDRLHEQWLAWETWFADIEESHTSLAVLVFFRSPRPEHAWITAAGAVLDAASLTLAVVDTPHDPQADLCIRAGYLALRHIADYFSIAYDPRPAPTDPISITRQEFDAACQELVQQGVPLKPDLDQAWSDFNGWRVNYDTVLLALAGLTVAPYAPWSSDRGLVFHRPPILRPYR